MILMVRRRASAVSNHEARLHPSRRGEDAAPQDEGESLSSTKRRMTVASIETGSAAGLPLEKTPLESYVPPAKPSLIGLSRAELADRLGEIGIAPAQRRMRVQQLWHWIYF